MIVNKSFKTIRDVGEIRQSIKSQILKVRLEPPLQNISGLRRLDAPWQAGPQIRAVMAECSLTVDFCFNTWHRSKAAAREPHKVTT